MVLLRRGVRRARDDSCFILIRNYVVVVFEYAPEKVVRLRDVVLRKMAV